MSEIEITIEPHGWEGHMIITAAGVPRAVISFYAEKDQSILRPGTWRHDCSYYDDPSWITSSCDKEVAIINTIDLVDALAVRIDRAEAPLTTDELLASLTSIKAELKL